MATPSAIEQFLVGVGLDDSALSADIPKALRRMQEFEDQAQRIMSSVTDAPPMQLDTTAAKAAIEQLIAPVERVGAVWDATVAKFRDTSSGRFLSAQSSSVQ